MSLAGGGTQSFLGSLTAPPYGTYTHGIMLVDNSFTVQGELILDVSATNRYCYIEAGMNVNCQNSQKTPPRGYRFNWELLRSEPSNLQLQLHCR